MVFIWNLNLSLDNFLNTDISEKLQGGSGQDISGDHAQLKARYSLIWSQMNLPAPPWNKLLTDSTESMLIAEESQISSPVKPQI